VKKIRKQKQFEQRLLRSGKIIGIVFVICGVSWLGGEAKRFLNTNSFFQIESISFEENNLLKQTEAQEVLDSNYNLNFFGFNLSGLKNKLEKIPQVKNVTVKRKFPNIVQIKIEERAPVFILNLKDSFYGVDRDGYLFPQFKERSNWDLPVITGLDNKYLEDCMGNKKILPEFILALKINAYIKENCSRLPMELSEVHFEEKSDGFSLYTFNPRLELRLLKDDLERELENLSVVLLDLRNKDDLTASIDLRFKEKVFVDLKG